MKSILLIGINNFGTMIAKQLHDLGHQVLAFLWSQMRRSGTVQMRLSCARSESIILMSAS